MAVTENNREELREAFRVDNRNRDFRMTVYIDSLKIVGRAVLSKPLRHTSLQPADLLRSFPDDYMTLSRPTVYCRQSQTVVDEPDFITINLRQVDAFHAVELDEEGQG